MSGDRSGVGAQTSLLAALNQLLDGVARPSTGDHDGANGAEVRRIIDSWNSVAFEASAVASWTPDQARDGLAALEKLARSTAAVRAALIVQVGLGRDTAAAVTRATGMTQRAARAAVRVAQTVSSNPGVGDRLAAGEVSVAQVEAVSGLTSVEAMGLLDLACSQSDDEFARTVERFKVDQAGHMRADRQQLLRSVRFSDGPEGCLRVNAVLPSLEGAEVRSALDRICDSQWRKAHPKRARTRGAHQDEPRERRLADALVQLARGRSDDLELRNGGPTPAVIVTVDAETLRTTLLPDTPLDPSVAADLLPRAQVYAAIRDHTAPAQLSFGRNRRLASPMQRLVLSVVQPRCAAAGCDVPAQRCEVHHRVEYDAGGATDLPNLINLCSAHHHHLHDSVRNDREDDPWGDHQDVRTTPARAPNQGHAA